MELEEETIDEPVLDQVEPTPAPNAETKAAAKPDPSKQAVETAPAAKPTISISGPAKNKVKGNEPQPAEPATVAPALTPINQPAQPTPKAETPAQEPAKNEAPANTETPQPAKGE